MFTADGTQLEVAPNGRRAMAAVIDSLVAVVLTAIAGAVSSAAGASAVAQVQVMVAALAGSIMIYMVLPTILTGQSLGKRLTQPATMVVDRMTGHLPTPLRVVTHYVPILFGLLISGGLAGAPLAGMIGLSFFMTRDGASLGDKLSKTAVVIARYRPVRVR